MRGMLDIQDGFGNTALHLACVDGSEECVRMLIEVLGQLLQYIAV